jgi:thiol peroxidase
MAVERPGGVILKDKPLTLVGAALRAGDKAPDFSVLATDFSTVTLASSRDKVRLIFSVPSLDTRVCDAETKRFNEVATNLGDHVSVLCISCDLPGAQARWCRVSNVDRVQTLSDHRDLSFGDAYGTHIKELRLLSRGVFIVDANDMIRYAQYVPDFGQEPDYDDVLAAMQRIARP